MLFAHSILCCRATLLTELVLFAIKSKAKSTSFIQSASSKDGLNNSISSISYKSGHIISNISLSETYPKLLNNKTNDISSFK
jgi:hypothetical protein